MKIINLKKNTKKLLTKVKQESYGNRNKISVIFVKKDLRINI